jgi:hypothetical protein
MKTTPLLIVLAAALLAAVNLGAKEKRIPAPAGVLPLIVVESVSIPGNAYSDFERLDVAFQKVAKQRKWPVKVVTDRMASGVPDYLTELDVSLMPLRQQVPGEFWFRAWTSVYVDGKKTDLDVITFRYTYRVAENMEDTLEKVFEGGAHAIADKVEPLLFPDLHQEKK